MAAFIRLLQPELLKPNSRPDIQQKTFSEKCCYFSYYFYQRNVLTNCEQSITLHTVDLTVKNLHRIPSVDLLSPAWLVLLQALSEGIAVPGHETRHLLQAHLFFTPSGIWKLPDAYFTKKNTKAVNINLTTMDHLISQYFSLGCL